MDITYQYTKLRSQCGRQPLFCEQGPDMCDTIVTNPLEFKNFILRNPVHESIQNTPKFSQNTVNTIRADYSSSGANHAEGGWPKDVNLQDPEATQRYRRKIEKEDNYIHCVMTQAPGVEHFIMQNNAVDLYRSYYREMHEMPEVEHNFCRTVNVFRDKLLRPAVSLNWQPEHPRFCVCYVNVDFYRVSHSPNTAYIWNVDNPNVPETLLEPPEPMFDLIFSPRESETLVGGIATGQVVVFDRRRGGAPINSCPPHVAHRDITARVLFIQSKSGKEFFSSGPDGAVKWWDLRNLNEPTDEMILDLVKVSTETQTMARSFGVSVMEYEPTIPTRFMVGTENGLVISGNRKGKTPLEQLPLKFDAHNGPILSLERNPGFLKTFLTVGDWRACAWSEDCRESPVLWTPPLRQRITCGAWSPTRHSLMLLCGADGRLSIWDLLRRQHEPVLSVQLCHESLLSQSVHEMGSLVALGTSRGQVILVELSHTLANSDKNDKLMLAAVFERESNRERILEARLREIKLKMRQGQEGTPQGSQTDIDVTQGDRDLIEATNEFNAIVKKELSML